MSVVQADTPTQVSIKTTALVQARRLEPGEVGFAQEEFADKSAAIGLSSEIEYFNQEFSPALRGIRNSSPEIAKWIEFQQRILASLAHQLDSQRAVLADLQPQLVSISATTMEFQSETSYDAGDTLEITLSLGEMLPTILLMGQVTEGSDADTGASTAAGSSTINIRFCNIRESDQEVLIRHIHRSQIQELQNARANRKTTVSGGGEQTAGGTDAVS